MNGYAIIGCGGPYRIIREILTDGFIGYFDDEETEDPERLGGLDDLKDFSEGSLFIGIAALRNMLLREALIRRIGGRGDPSLTAISSRTYVAPSATVGGGSVLCPFTCVNSDASIGPHSILFSNVTVEHDSRIGANANVAPGVTFSGKVKVGDNVFVGAGATVKDGVSIGSNSVIGAGSLVLSDIPAGVVAYGSPAAVTGPNTFYRPVGA